jgi:hypothetical protein
MPKSTYPFKVVIKEQTTYHNSRTIALLKARKNKGTAYEHNPFATESDHKDEMGVWVAIK